MPVWNMLLEEGMHDYLDSFETDFSVENCR